MRVLVTGDRGFVGSATMALLSDAVGFDLMDGFDIRDQRQLERQVTARRIDRILHLAAIARFTDSDADPLRAFETNVLGTRNVVEVAEKYHLPLVYASTGSVYMPISQEPPITEDFPATGNSVYGCSKRMGELYVEHSSVPWIILRYAHLYGAEKRGHGLIGGFIDRINRGLAPRLYGGTQSNDFCYIDDVARANVLALGASFDRWNQAYNIGTGEELSAEDAGKAVCKAWGYTGPVEQMGERSVDADRFVYDTSKAERMLGFKAAYTFADGLEQMADLIRVAA